MSGDLLTSLLQFVGAIAALIIIHELGHFIVARLVGVEIEEFGLGYPPRIITLFEAGGTKFSLNWLPFGGFVRPKGENDPDVPGGLASANPWARIAVLLAGPIMNLLAGVVLFALIFGRVGVPTFGPVEVIEVAPGSPAEMSGLQAGDMIMRVNEIEIDSAGTLQENIYANLGNAIELTVERGESTEVVSLVPRTDPPENEGAIGIIMNTTGPMREVSVGEGLVLGAGAVFEQARTLITLPAQIYQGRIAAEDARLVGYKGMFDIYQTLQETEVEAGTPPGVGALFFAASITVSLGLLNLLPIPALDGGRILFTLPEILFRRRIPPSYEAMINLVSISLLLLLMIYINVQDFVNPATFR
jgi:regulator of sigma E protease